MLNPSQNLTYLLLIHFIASITMESSRFEPVILFKYVHFIEGFTGLHNDGVPAYIASSRLPDISLISSNYMAIRSFHYVYETLNLLSNRCSIGLKHRLVQRHEKITLPDNYLRKHTNRQESASSTTCHIKHHIQEMHVDN